MKTKPALPHRKIYDAGVDACYLAKVARQERKKENVSKKEEDTKEKGSLEKEA